MVILFWRIKKIIFLIFLVSFVSCAGFGPQEDRVRIHNNSNEIMNIIQLHLYGHSKKDYFTTKTYRNLMTGSMTPSRVIAADDFDYSRYGLEIRASADSGLSYNKDITLKNVPNEEESFIIVLQQDGSVEVQKE